MPAIPLHDITGLVLAGGQGRRMGGRDKGLMRVGGQPLVAWTLARLAAQVGMQAICANRHLDDYRSLGVPVWADAQPGGGVGSCPDFRGPLAGMAAGLAHCTTPWLAVVPCDSPCFPEDLVARLTQAVVVARADVAFAVTFPEERPQPVFCLLRTALRADIQRFLADGGRKVLDWMQQCRHVTVRFDEPTAFAGANTPQELATLEERLTRLFQ